MVDHPYIAIPLLVLTVFALIVGLVSLCASVYNIQYCNTMTRLDSTHEYKWEFWGGCLVHLPSGRWADATEFRNGEFQIEK